MVASMQTRSARRLPPLPSLTLILSWLVLVPLVAAEPTLGTLRETFPAKSGGRLVLHADRGSVELTGSDVDEVVVEVIRRVTRGSASQAEDLLADHQVRFSQDGETVRVDAASTKRLRWNLLGPNLEVEFRVSLPRVFSVEAETAGGGVRADHLKGDLDLRTSGGSIRLEDVAGTVRGRTSGGSIRGSRVEGTVELMTTGGSIAVEGVSGKELKVRTSGGSVKLAGIAVPADARTSGGSIQLEGSTGPVTGVTSGGSITARLTEVPKGDISLQTSGGSIELALPGHAAFELDAATSGGSVRSEFATEAAPGNPARSVLRSPVNGGGVGVKLRTSGGGIRVRRL